MKIGQYIYLIFSVLLLSITLSCNKLNETIYSNLPADGYTYKPSDIYSVVGAVYPNMRNFYGAFDLFSMQQITTDALVLPANASGWDDGGRYKTLQAHTWTSGLFTFAGVWNNLYAGVLLSNNAIEALKSGQFPPPPGTTIEQYIAEAKTARAFYYWLLMDNFGNVPYLSITLTSTSQNADLPSNSSRAVVYDSIVNDLTSSINDLSEDNSSAMYGRFNKWGAKALLASVYLNAQVYTGTAHWAECLQQCNDIIASGKYTLEANYADCFSAQNQNSKESIFAIPYDEINAGGMYLNYTFHAASKATFNLLTTPWGAGGEKAVTQFIDTYTPSDTRIDDTWLHGLQYAADGTTPIYGSYDRAGQQIDYAKNITDGLYTKEDEGYRIVKFRPKLGANYNLDNDYPFFRYAHVLMMKAECLLRTGNANEAAAIVTDVRTRDFAGDLSKATVTGAQLTADSKYNWGYYLKPYGTTTAGGLDKGDATPVQYGGLYDELGYEFAAEDSRRRDMIRFGTFTKKSWLSHKPNGDFRIIFPIPQAALDANSKLVQNSGY